MNESNDACILFSQDIDSKKYHPLRTFTIEPAEDIGLKVLWEVVR
jgi:hypothetical protein